MTEVPAVDPVDPVVVAPEPPAPVAESDVVNAAKGAVRSFIIVFITVMIPAVFSFTNGIYGWANEGGHAPFPEVSTLGFTGVAAAMAGLAAALTFVIRFAENKLGVGLLRSSIPVDDAPVA